MVTDLTTTLLIIIPVILISMAVHEMMHALVSYKLGDDFAHTQGRVSLNPFVHIDPVLTLGMPILLALVGAPIFAAAKPVPVNFNRLKWGEFGGAIVGAVGPLSNVILAVVGSILLHSVFFDSSGMLVTILAYFVAINIGLAVFNSIPWPPLDGSRVLYAFAPRSLQAVMEVIEGWGIAGLVIFILLFFQFIAPFVGNLVQDLTRALI